MDRPKVKALRARLEAALKAAFGEEMGVMVGSARFTKTSVQFKIEMSEPNAQGQVESPHVTAFKTHCKLFGLEPTDLGRTFVSRGRTFKIVGILPKCYKNPIAADAVDNGKKFKFPVEVVKAGFGGKATIPAVVVCVPSGMPLPGRRFDADILADLRQVENDLSPENLTCDGEITNPTHLRIRRSNLEKRKKELIEELGRTPSEEELLKT